MSDRENATPTRSEIGSVFAKHDRSGFDGDDYWRNSKLARAEGFSEYKTMSLHQGIPLLRSTSLISSEPRRPENILSFSSSDKFEALGFEKDGCLDYKSYVSPYLQHFAPSDCRNTGYGTGGVSVMNTNMHGNLTGIRGTFTMTQWVELEQQALIYKYITSNVPVPSSLLLSLKKSFFPYSTGSLPPNSFGWGCFHLGLGGGSMDPEPGRCRRTDGKKWRCSRDAVPDQKYCERHINRGRHRSRKPVETQSARTAPGPTTPSKKACASAPPPDRPLTIPALPNSSADSLAKRVQNSRVASVFPSTVNLQPKESPMAHRKEENPFEFGSYLDFSRQEKDSVNSKMVVWPEELKSDWTQLSMSIPNVSSASAQDETELSPLRLSRELDPAGQMGVGVNTERHEPDRKLDNWVPTISWGNSMGGPLGEVLNSATNSPCRLGSSPTGVLQSSTFCSLSNSSSGSSPVADNKN